VTGTTEGGGFDPFARIIDVPGMGQAVAFKQRDMEGCPCILLNCNSAVGIVGITMSFSATPDGNEERDAAFESMDEKECHSVMAQLYMKIAEAAAQAKNPQIILPNGVNH
jgi:hypothetical protein